MFKKKNLFLLLLIFFFAIVFLIFPSFAKHGFNANAQLSSAIVINHSNTNLSTIPTSWITQARSLKSVLRHASVGGNISLGLDDLFNQNSLYNRSSFTFLGRGNPGWQAKVDDLDSYTASHVSEYDIFAQKFCYIDTGAQWEYYRAHMENLEASYPTKTFVWWTMPITTTGSGVRDAFNNQVRSYCQANDKVLFDIADIESHDPGGNPVTNNGYEALYSDFTSDGGHLNELGRQRVASAYWWLMARLAGWDGGSSPAPTLTSTPTPTVIPTSTPTSTPTPTPVSIPGDANSDGKVDGIDYVVWLNHYNTSTGSGATDGDFNVDGKVDGIDYVVWLNNYGS